MWSQPVDLAELAPSEAGLNPEGRCEAKPKRRQTGLTAVLGGLCRTLGEEGMEGAIARHLAGVACNGGGDALEEGCHDE